MAKDKHTADKDERVNGTEGLDVFDVALRWGAPILGAAAGAKLAAKLATRVMGKGRLKKAIDAHNKHGNDRYVPEHNKKGDYITGSSSRNDEIYEGLGPARRYNRAYDMSALVGAATGAIGADVARRQLPRRKKK